MAEPYPPVPQLTTAGVIARKLGVPLHRVQYVLRTRTHIKHTAWGGNLRLFPREAIAMVSDELELIESNKRSLK